MRMTDPVAVLLAMKGGEVIAVRPDASVLDAIEVMARRGIGAVMVMDGDRLAGVLSERDYARRVILEGRSSRDTRVAEIMTRGPVTVSPAHTVEECLHRMTHHRIRHLPVVDGDLVVGVLSIGDLVNWIISAQAETIQFMESYIAGSYPA
jgi:CBS domain-containing protein